MRELTEVETGFVGGAGWWDDFVNTIKNIFGNDTAPNGSVYTPPAPNDTCPPGDSFTYVANNGRSVTVGVDVAAGALGGGSLSIGWGGNETIECTPPVGGGSAGGGGGGAGGGGHNPSAQ